MRTYVFAVFRLREVDQVIIVHVLGVEQVAILLLAQVFWIYSIRPQEFLIGHTKRLAYGLCN